MTHKSSNENCDKFSQMIQLNTILSKNIEKLQVLENVQK